MSGNPDGCDPPQGFGNRYIDPSVDPPPGHVLAMDVLTDDEIDRMLEEPDWLPPDWAGADEVPELQPLQDGAALTGFRLATANEIRRGLAERDENLPEPREDRHGRVAQLALVPTVQEVQEMAANLHDFLQIDPGGPDMIPMEEHRNIVAFL